MILYDHPDLSGRFRCPVCGTSEDRPVLKVPREWDSMGPISTVQVHLSCLDLRLRPRLDMFEVHQDLQLEQGDL